MKSRLILLALVFLIFGCSSKKPGVIECEKNEECPAGFKCDQDRGRCVDIYFPNLGSSRGV